MDCYFIPEWTLNLFTYLYLNELTVFCIIQWVIVVLCHFYLFWHPYWSSLGHAGTTSLVDTLLTFLKLLHPTPDCLPTQMLSQSTGALVPRSWPLQFPQTGTNAYLTLFHLMALELNCSRRRGEGSRRKERENEPKLQFDNKLCSLKILRLKIFFPWYFLNFIWENHQVTLRQFISIWACVYVCVCVYTHMYTLAVTQLCLTLWLHGLWPSSSSVHGVLRQEY